MVSARALWLKTGPAAKHNRSGERKKIANPLITTLNRRVAGFALNLPSVELSADLTAASPLHTCLLPCIVLG